MTLTGSSPEVKIRWTIIRIELRPNRWTVHYEVLLIYDFEKLTQRSHWRSYRMAQKPKTPLKSPKKWDPPELALNKTWLKYIYTSYIDCYGALGRLNSTFRCKIFVIAFIYPDFDWLLPSSFLHMKPTQPRNIPMAQNIIWMRKHQRRNSTSPRVLSPTQLKGFK